MTQNKGYDWHFAAYIVTGEDEKTSHVEDAKTWITGKIFSVRTSVRRVKWYPH